MSKTLISVALALTVLAGAGAFATASAEDSLYQETSPFADHGATGSVRSAAGASSGSAGQYRGAPFDMASESAVNRDEQTASLRFVPRRHRGDVNGNTVNKTDEPE